jgi:1-acyl-sn-glycerol-3-phosphate acyltransferase
MIARLSRFFLRLFGWKTSAILPPGVEKAVLIVAPHTSYYDFVVGRLTFWAARIKIKVLIKKESFGFPFGIVLRQLGGVPVDRGKKNNLVEEVAELYRQHDKMIVVITPEGTRKKVRHWKRGFYQIAMAANVPIAMAYIDYANKTGGIGPMFYPTGDYDRDIQEIMKFYRDISGRHPERFSVDLPQKK